MGSLLKEIALLAVRRGCLWMKYNASKTSMLCTCYEEANVADPMMKTIGFYQVGEGLRHEIFGRHHE